MELFAHREKIETRLFGVIHEQDECANAYSFQSTPARGTVVTYSFTRINLDRDEVQLNSEMPKSVVWIFDLLRKKLLESYYSVLP